MRIEQQYIDIFSHYEEMICRHSASVLNAHRTVAMSHFKQLGFPTCKQE
ncbi:hypothetical protein EZS27_030436, partial [termite gut metagenome]